MNLPEENILLALHGSFAEAGGVELELPERRDAPRPVDLS
jgi:hypothetical protein